MNTASRMESNSQACRINLSPEAAAALLAQAPDVVLLPPPSSSPLPLLRPLSPSSPSTSTASRAPHSRSPHSSASGAPRHSARAASLSSRK